MCEVVLGAHAADMLRDPAFSATAIAAGRSAIYLRTDAGGIFWLAPPGGVRHPRAILLDPYPAWLRVGMSLSIVEGCLSVDGRMIGDLGHATSWRHERKSAWNRPSADGIAARLREAARLAADLPNATPLLKLTCALALDDHVEPEPTGLDAFTSRAWPALADAVRGVAEQNPEAIERLVLAIAGLGPGLTPSGDDAIGGFLFALACGHAGNAPRPQCWGSLHMQPLRIAGVGRTANEARSWTTKSTTTVPIPSSPSIGGWGALLAARTHEISLAIVTDLAEGHGPEPLHCLAYEILDERSEGLCARSIARVAAIGHQSGRDLLAGFLAGLTALNRMLDQPARLSCTRHSADRHLPRTTR